MEEEVERLPRVSMRQFFWSWRTGQLMGRDRNIQPKDTDSALVHFADGQAAEFPRSAYKFVSCGFHFPVPNVNRPSSRKSARRHHVSDSPATAWNQFALTGAGVKRRGVASGCEAFGHSGGPQ